MVWLSTQNLSIPGRPSVTIHGAAPYFPSFTSLYLYYGLLPSSGLTALRHCLNPSIPISIDLTPCYYFAIPFPLLPLLVGPLEPTIYKPLYFTIFPSA